jgi:hypothetical protein
VFVGSFVRFSHLFSASGANNHSQSMYRRRITMLGEMSYEGPSGMTETSASAEPGQGRYGDRSDVIVTCLAGAVILGIVTWYALFTEHSVSRGGLVLAGTACAVLGWTIGIMITPYNMPERARLGEIGRASYAALVGYLVAKFDRLYDYFLPTGKAQIDASVFHYLGVGGTMFLTAVVVTYVTRSYDWRASTVEGGRS